MPFHISGILPYDFPCQDSAWRAQLGVCVTDFQMILIFSADFQIIANFFTAMKCDAF